MMDTDDVDARAPSPLTFAAAIALSEIARGPPASAASSQPSPHRTLRSATIAVMSAAARVLTTL